MTEHPQKKQHSYTVVKHISIALVLSLFSALTVANNLIDKGATWRYLDNGSELSSSWTTSSFNDTSWAQGAGQLGYGDGDESTVISYGDSRSSKYITSYFRHFFQVTDTSTVDGLTLNLLRDDGAVVYLNGQEVFRSNLPQGSINYLTPATNAAGGSGEKEYFSKTLSADLLVNGSNLIAVEVHQASSGSSDVSFDLSLITSAGEISPGDGSLLRGPYLQMGSDSRMTIKWRTDGSTDSLVLYGTDPNTLDQSVSSSQVTTEHEVVLSGLSADTRYYYSIGSTGNDGILLGDNSTYFETSPTPGTATPTRMWVVGDAGTKNNNQRNVYNAYLAETGSQYTDLFIMLGDNAYSDGLDHEYQEAVFDMYPQLLRTTPVWSTLGNHDGHSADSETESGPYYDIFTFPRQGEIGGVASGTEAYYSFDYGNIHFIVLDSFETSRHLDGSMISWMQNDIQQATADWTIAFWHHPPYTKGSHNSDTESDLIQMRENFLPILEQNGVDLVLNGHSHSYERTKFIDGHYGLSNTFSNSQHAIDANGGHADGTGAYTKAQGNPAHQGAVYITAGSSGKKSGGALDHAAMFTSLNELGSLIIEVDGLTLNTRFIDDNGAVQDYFTISKSGELPPQKASISGLAWLDQDKNGIRNSNETHLAAIAVQLINQQGNIVASKTTNGQGEYSFTNLNAGNYSIKFTPGIYNISPENQGNDRNFNSDIAIATATSPMLSLTAASNTTHIDIGLYQDEIISEGQAIPGVILATSYDQGGAGISYYDTSAGNSGNSCHNRSDNVDTEQGSLGCNLGWINNGEWLNYTVNIAETGLYNIDVRLASASVGSAFHLELDGENITGTITAPATGSWQSWQSKSLINIGLSQGQHLLKFVADGAQFNLYDLSFTLNTDSGDSSGDNQYLLPIVQAEGSSELQAASLAIDGDLTTSWSSYWGNSSWFIIDLGQAYDLAKVKIFWQQLTPSDYIIQGSLNNASWDTLSQQTDGTFGTRTDNVSITGHYRYIRLYAEARSQGNTEGYEISEIQVYSPE
ncbi:hypothetical protein CJF42_00835 [Pseudoalteromonas sp. NBT06-2]|uniref:SdrD B-like domain-containing protein n=1 Tax=Pseudoalteromonas sp. NBT06-2 TaxID=2025950 RepID=UPI000BA654C7|nr:SdrD B-like domain-containing protein [Pseudoalteromonas sp. NBT06-2]PAJ76268.1 hypothetical protein CJF42_00835 [Pseudoalteromonas sp. NBT06-2]